MENAGEYCQVAVDAKGGIHIAAYDPSLCDLVYAYLPSYDGTAQTCVVDSNGVLGSNLTIDVALDENGKAIPRIGYYATSCIRPKLAYLINGVDSVTGTSSTYNKANSYSSQSYGFVYGNGTANPVMGYAVKNGSGDTIETAQMK